MDARFSPSEPPAPAAESALWLKWPARARVADAPAPAS